MNKLLFFLIGENHGMAEIPKFTAALFEAYKKHGYQYFATETGPFTAAFLQQTASRKDMHLGMASFLKEYPWSIPFYGWQEECEILKTVVGNKPSEKQLIWGLDQEFAASPRMNFLRLKKSAKTEASKKVATEYYEMAMSAFKESTETKNPGKSFMGIVRPDDFVKLKTAFKGQPQNLKLIEALEESIYIYQLWFQREGYKSNQLRAEMMKRYFWDYYSKAKVEDDPPKIMFKFGSNHMYRGANALNVFDIGNFISEMASQMNTESFHLYVLGRKGNQNAYNPFSQDEADKQKPYDASKYLDNVDVSTVLSATSETDWSVIDLRPIRKALFNHFIKNVNPGLEKLIWSYDAILVIPEVSASTFFNEKSEKE